MHEAPRTKQKQNQNHLAPTTSHGIATGVENQLAALTSQQRLYAEGRLHGLSPPEAAKAAGMAHPTIQCYAYEKHPKIAPLLKLMNSASIQKYNLTRDDVIAGFLDAVSAAGSSTELTAAWREIGKMLGHYEPERVEHTLTVDNMTVNKLETMTEKELLKMSEMDEFTLDRDHDLVADYKVLEDGS